MRQGRMSEVTSALSGQIAFGGDYNPTGPWTPHLPRATSRSSLRPRRHPRLTETSRWRSRQSTGVKPPRPRELLLFGSGSDLRADR